MKAAWTADREAEELWLRFAVLNRTSLPMWNDEIRRLYYDLENGFNQREQELMLTQASTMYYRLSYLKDVLILSRQMLNRSMLAFVESSDGLPQVASSFNLFFDVL